jgi:hypothetical protein
MSLFSRRVEVISEPDEGRGFGLDERLFDPLGWAVR